MVLRRLMVAVKRRAFVACNITAKDITASAGNCPARADGGRTGATSTGRPAHFGRQDVVLQTCVPAHLYRDDRALAGSGDRQLSAGSRPAATGPDRAAIRSRDRLVRDAPPGVGPGRRGLG